MGIVSTIARAVGLRRRPLEKSSADDEPSFSPMERAEELRDAYVRTWVTEQSMMISVSTGFQDCMDIDGNLEREPLPSAREDEWKARFRHSLAEAVNLAQREVVNITVNGSSLQDCVNKWPDYMTWKR